MISPSTSTCTISSPGIASINLAAVQRPSCTLARNVSYASSGSASDMSTSPTVSGACVPRTVQQDVIATAKFLSEKQQNRKRLVLTDEEQERWSATVRETQSSKVESDATRLPRSTNMGIKHTFKHTQMYVPPVHDGSSQSEWEEDETAGSGSKRAASKSAKRAQFVKVIPTVMVESIPIALAFYQAILGFSLVDKPDGMRANIVRAVDGELNGAGKSVRRGKEPINGVELYLRVPPIGDDGKREQPTKSTLWISVENIDEYYAEIAAKQQAASPTGDEYFPRHHLATAHVASKPQNKASGNREAHVVDADGNKIIFYTELKARR